MDYTSLFNKGETNQKQTIQKEIENKKICTLTKLFDTLEKIKEKNKKEHFKWNSIRTINF